MSNFADIVFSLEKRLPLADKSDKDKQAYDKVIVRITELGIKKKSVESEQHEIEDELNETERQLDKLASTFRRQCFEPFAQQIREAKLEFRFLEYHLATNSNAVAYNNMQQTSETHSQPNKRSHSHAGFLQQSVESQRMRMLSDAAFEVDRLHQTDVSSQIGANHGILLSSEHGLSSSGSQLPILTLPEPNIAALESSLPTSNADISTAPQVQSTQFALLLYSLGGSKVRESVLYHGLSPQKRWDERGHMQEATLVDAGLERPVVDLFASEHKLRRIIESCIQLHMIRVDRLADNSVAYSLSEETKDKISRSFKDEDLGLQGLIFVTHVFPRDHALQDLYVEKVRQLLY